MVAQYIEAIIHLLDYFFLIAAPYDSCLTQLNRFLNFCAFIWLAIAPEKRWGPLTTLLDTIKLEARLPLDKLRKYINFRHIVIAGLDWTGLDWTGLD